MIQLRHLVSCLQWQRTQKESCGKSSKEEKKIASFALTCSVYCIWLNPRSCINFEINTFFPLLKYKRLHQMEGHFVYLLINHKVLHLVPLTSIVGFKKKKKKLIQVRQLQRPRHAVPFALFQKRLMWLGWRQIWSVLIFHGLLHLEVTNPVKSPLVPAIHHKMDWRTDFSQKSTVGCLEYW